MTKTSKKGKKTAIDAKRGTVFLVDPDDLVIIEDPKHPLYDPRVEKPLSEAFITRIKLKGVMQPISVRKDGPKIEVVAGRQRVRAAREANKRLRAEGHPTLAVPCMLRAMSDVEAFEDAVVENEHREDDSPLAKATKANRLLRMGRTEAQIAELFAVTVTTVKGWLGVLNLDPKVQAAVEQGRIGFVDAVRKLGTLTRADQVKALDEMVKEGNGTVERGKLRGVVEKHGGHAGSKPLPGKKQIRRILDLDREADQQILNKREHGLLSWLTGESSDGRIGEMIPGFLPLLRRSERQEKARKEAS